MSKIPLSIRMPVSFMLLASLITSCDTPITGDPPSSTSTNLSDSNELFIFTVWPAYFVDEEIFDRQITQYVKQKFPDITIKHIAWDDESRYEDILAKGLIPDIIMDDTGMNLRRYIMKYDLHYDMNALIKQYNFDLGTLIPSVVDQVENTNSAGEIYGLPFHINDYILFYNKDIFDRFSVEYPREGITYDEAYELAKQLTRVDGDDSIKGYLQHRGHYMAYNQLSLSPLHLTEDQANMKTEGWARLVDNLRRFYEIPGNKFGSVDRFPEGKIAMTVSTVDRIVRYYEQAPNLNFDVTSIPSFPELPNIKAQPNLYSMYITKQSEKKDLAFQVVSYLLSEEYWLQMSKEGLIGPLNSPAVQEVFGQNLPQMQGKNVKGLFSNQNAMPPAARAEGLTHIDVFYEYPFYLIEDENIDAMTALEKTDVETNKGIEEIKAAQGNGAN